MNILVFNCGSSSLSYKVFAADTNALTVAASGKAHRVGVTGSEPSFVEHIVNNRHDRAEVPIADHGEAAALILAHLQEAGVAVDAVGHRFVHGGAEFQASARIDAACLEQLERCIPLAPLHAPMALGAIRAARDRFPELPQYVTFDSAFHASLPEAARTYALPADVVEHGGFRKFGFHGLSYQDVAGTTSRFLNRSLQKLRLIICHLGTGGSSVAAIRGGRSVETSMGYSPLPGLVMSTRSGDLDPMVPLLLIEQYGYTPEQVTDLLNKQSGLLGLSGFSSDMRDIIRRRDETGDACAALAFDVYIHRLRHYIGAYMVVLGGVDAVVFTDDVGLRCWQVREAACRDIGWAGITIDDQLNRAAMGAVAECISSSASRVAVLVVPNDEERVIAEEGLRLLSG